MRRDDPAGANYDSLRRSRERSPERMVLQPGSLVVPVEAIALGAIVTSSMVVTVYDAGDGRGGMCHFVRSIPGQGEPSSPVFGAPAIAALLRAFARPEASRLSIGMYGGACPSWASSAQQADAEKNIDIVRRVIQRRNLHLAEEDVGGQRARKIWYHTGTNEIVVAKTDEVRQSDWFPEVRFRKGAT